MKIYLAGKISGGDWRLRVVPQLIRIEGDKDWPILSKAVLKRHDYVGPYLSWPGRDSHVTISSDTEHGLESLGQWNHYGDLIECRFRVAQKCIRAIDSCDLLFAWIESDDAFGTFAEIGYAIGKGKSVFVASTSESRSDEMWFFESMSAENSQSSWGADDVTTALSEAIEWCEGSPHLKLHLCESPIEKMFFEAAIDLWWGRDLVPQHHIGSYRLDFAIPEAKFCIEIDGHDAHKTKEQRTHDASRERWLELNGWRVVRFTGSEIYKNARKCVAEAKKLFELNVGVGA